MIPRTFEEWQRCIINDCKINLSKEFAEQRLMIYQDDMNAETLKFASLYGEQHLQNVISWYKRIV